MLQTHKRNILCEYEVKWSRNVDLGAEKPPKLAKIAIFSVRDFRNARIFQNLSSSRPFNIFWCGFLHHVKQKFLLLFVEQIFELGPRSRARRRDVHFHMELDVAASGARTRT